MRSRKMISVGKIVLVFFFDFPPYITKGTSCEVFSSLLLSQLMMRTRKEENPAPCLKPPGAPVVLDKAQHHPRKKRVRFSSQLEIFWFHSKNPSCLYHQHPGVMKISEVEREVRQINAHPSSSMKKEDNREGKKKQRKEYQPARS